MPVVFDEAVLSEPVHEEPHSGTCRSDHLRQRLLADLSNSCVHAAIAALARQSEKNSGEALFAGIEQLVDEFLLQQDVSTQNPGRKKGRQRGLRQQRSLKCSFVQPGDLANGYQGYLSLFGSSVPPENFHR